MCVWCHIHVFSSAVKWVQSGIDDSCNVWSRCSAWSWSVCPPCLPHRVWEPQADTTPGKSKSCTIHLQRSYFTDYTSMSFIVLFTAFTYVFVLTVSCIYSLFLQPWAISHDLINVKAWTLPVCFCRNDLRKPDYVSVFIVFCFHSVKADRKGIFSWSKKPWLQFFLRPQCFRVN